jgi:superoxide dismutase, Cu-Zn family
MLHRRILAGAAALLAAGIGAAHGEVGDTATVAMKGADGGDLGSVTLTETNSGVLVKAELTGLPPGPHGFHFHAVGQCEPPFESAGDHYNPTNVSHGFLAEGGPHVGDMPNIHVPESASITVEMLNSFVSLTPDSGNTLFDDDGTAIVVHADPDDYEGQPSGHAGDRIACGVVDR